MVDIIRYSKKNMCSICTLLGALALIVAVNFLIQHNKRKEIEIIDAVYSVLNSYRITDDIDKKSMGIPDSGTMLALQGVEQCKKNLHYFIVQKKPLALLLVGFPFKSSNQEKKVIGYLPDMAERKGLEYLAQMLREVKNVYGPGATLMIFCDGIPFAEFFGIAYEHVVAYENALKVIAQDLPGITLYTSEDMMQAHALISPEQIHTYIDTFEPSDQQCHAQFSPIPETPLKRFSFELDHKDGAELIKKSSLEDIVFRLLAREMRLRTFIAKEFSSPEFFRLTVHFSPDISKKFGIRLSPTSWVTPYHGVMIEECDGSWSIQFKKNIDISLYEQRTKIINGMSCYYYARR
jgi:pyoverdine/dityrosine biosynthesis protein Dit1